MDQKILGLGLTAVTLFIRWVFPTIPKPIAWSGLSIGITVVALSFFPGVKAGPAILGLAGIGLLAASIIWQYTSKLEMIPPSSSPASFSATSQEKAKITGIDLNKYSKKACFDYSTNNGLIAVYLNDIGFELRFSKASNNQIHLYKDGTNLVSLSRLKNVNPGDEVNFEAFDNTSRSYTVGLGEYFIARNNSSYFLLGRILSIKDDSRGDNEDEVCFAYFIDLSKIGRFRAI